MPKRALRPGGPHQINPIFDFKTKDGRMHGQYKNNRMEEVRERPPYRLWTAFMKRMSKARGTYQAPKGGRTLTGWSIGGGRRERKYKRSRLFLGPNGQLMSIEQGVCVYCKFGHTWLPLAKRR